MLRNFGDVLKKLKKDAITGVFLEFFWHFPRQLSVNQNGH